MARSRPPRGQWPDAKEETPPPTSGSTKQAAPTQDRPRRPRPAVCSSAKITRPSFDHDVPARSARSFVLVTRFHTAIRRPIRCRRQTIFDLVGTEPLGRADVGSAPIRMQLDRQTRTTRAHRGRIAPARDPNQARTMARNRRRPRAGDPGGGCSDSSSSARTRARSYSDSPQVSLPWTVSSFRHRLVGHRATIEVECEIERRRRVSRGANADAVDSRLSQGTEPWRDSRHRRPRASRRGATRSRRLTASATSSGARLSTRMISGPRLSGPVELFECINLDLDRRTRGRIRPRGRDRRRDRVGAARIAGRFEPGQMIVLDEHSIIQTEAVIKPSATPDRVLFQGTPTRGGLARVVNRRAAYR